MTLEFLMYCDLMAIVVFEDHRFWPDYYQAMFDKWILELPTLGDEK